MRKLVLSIMFMCATTMAMADTVSIDWKVDGQTYSQSSCTVGGNLTLPTAPTKYGHTFLGWASFTPIEYIESSGTQYIKPGVVYEPETSRFLVEYALVSAPESGQACIWGGTTNGNTAVMLGACFSITSLLCSNMSTNAFVDTASSLGKKYIIESGKVENTNTWKCQLRNETGAVVSTSGSLNNISSYIGIYLFAHNSNGAVNRYVSMRLYSFKAYSNNTLVRDMIPVLDGNGVACMYDKVQDAFYYNDGTGDFIAGPAI